MICVQEHVLVFICMDVGSATMGRSRHKTEKGDTSFHYCSHEKTILLRALFWCHCITPVMKRVGPVEEHPSHQYIQ
jgi:hypothetical protein